MRTEHDVFHSEYRGWCIWTKNLQGLWTATNYSEGKGQLAADTLAGLKQLITAREQQS